jgi:Flp pilus assembly protein TadD
MRRLQDGGLEEAETLLTDAITLAPTFAPAFYERGMLRLANGEHAGARADLKRYLDLDPNGPHAADVRAMLSALDG